MPFRIFAAPIAPTAQVRNALAGSRMLVVLMLVTGIATLIGRASGITWLSAPVAGWRSMSATSGLCWIALALALWGRITDRRYLALGGAGFALGVNILVLLSNAFALPYYANAPLPSVVLVCTASIGLLSGVLQPRADVEKITLAVSGLALVALTVTVGFAHAIGVFDTSRVTGDLPGSSLQAVVNSFLLGVCFISLVWTSGFKELELPKWLPVAAGLAGLITVMSLWSALAEREREQQMEGAGQAAATEARLALREVEAHARSLKRAAEWAAFGANSEQQERDLIALARDIPSLQAIFRLGPDGIATAQYPPGADASVVRTVWRAYAGLNNGQLDSVVYAPLDSFNNRFVIFAPVCNVHCSGAVAGVVRSSMLFRTVVGDTSTAFRFNVAGPRGVLEGTPELVPRPTTARRELRVGQVTWNLFASPGSGLISRASNLPGTVLFMGLVVTLLLPLTIQLGRTAWEGSRDRERARLALALDRATDGIWELDLITGASVRSPALWRHLQYAPEAVPPNVEEWTALIHPDDRPSVYGAMSRHLAGESESYETEYRVRAANGDWHVVVDRGRVVDRTPHGEPARLLGISADVTEARAITKAKAESEQRVRDLFNSSFQFQILLDSDCKIIEINRVALDYAGAEREALINRECWDTMWWADNAAAQATLRNACQIAMTGQTKNWEQVIEQPGRLPLIFEISIKLIRGSDERRNQLVLEGRDITDRRRSEAWLKEVDTLTTMGRVAARVAHEINNPLAGIQNAFLLIKDAVPSDHRYFSYVGSIEREISRISNVTRQLYETYRPEQDTTGTASVHLIVADAVAFLEQVNRSRDFRVVTDLTRVPSAVPVPAAILRQIVYNLVQNAIDASPKGGIVKVIADSKANSNANSLELRVKDQGPGVPESLKEHIFEPFFSTKEKEMKTSGMGLGLALVKRTITAAGGTIVVNTLPEGGSEFLVVLPLESNEDGGAK